MQKGRHGITCCGGLSYTFYLVWRIASSDREKRKNWNQLTELPMKDIVVSVASFTKTEGSLYVRRFWLRLVSLLSLCVYLLANTQASFALDYWIRSQIHEVAPPEPASTDESTPQSRKCKNCTRVSEGNSDQQAPNSSNRPCKPCNDSSCPCGPNEHHHKDCPCPGGCALCSVAKAPCLTPWTATLDHAVCIGECCLNDSFDYLSPPLGGLIRPPRA